MKANCPAARQLSSLLFGAIFLALVSAGAAPKTHSLFTGKDFAGWRQPIGEWLTAKAVGLDTADPAKFTITPGDGVAVNGPRGKTVHLVTTAEFGDAQVHVEFCIAKRSNSGIYLMGRYEVQVYDSFGVAKDKYPGIECGGIYPRWQENHEVEGHSPRENASQPPGDWQSFDITFRAPRFDTSGRKTANARFVKVVHNGKTIHENVEVTGPTRSPLFDDEKATGPLMLQGDHGPVAYRHLRVTQLESK